MKYIIKTLENYLSRPTDYAVLINGPWGSGKTYYFNNTLKPLIDNTKIGNETDLKYRTVYISLYGVETFRTCWEIRFGFWA